MKRLIRLGAIALVGATASLAIAQDQPADVDAAQKDVADAQAALDAATVRLEAVEAAAEPYVPKKETFWTGWERTVDIGLSGASGSTERFNFRINLSANRMTEKMETRSFITYRYAKDDGTDSENRLNAGVNNDWLRPDSRWRYFARGLYEFDDFQDWDHRLSGFGGVGYELVKNEKTTLVGRLGVGGNQEFGGSQDGFTPEALLGLDGTHKFNDTMSIKGGAVYLPSLDDLTQYRVNAYFEYQWVLSTETNMILSAGIIDKYNSNPGVGAKKNDLDYYLMLGWKF